MIKSFMYDLYFGNLVPWERDCPQDPAYTPLTRKIIEICDYFQKQLSPDDYKKFEELGNLQSRSGTIEDVDIFEYGLSMGVLMMIDIFNFKEKRLTEQESE